jgi:uncharacterized protein (TIGR02145 family)
MKTIHTFGLTAVLTLIKIGFVNAQDFSGTHFRNGEPIPYIESKEDWTRAGENKQPAWCYYNNDPANGVKYGKLYNWYAVSDPRGLCPVGWHVPSDDEWTLLTDALGGEDVAKNKMKSTSGWKDNGNGNNSSSFSGLPGGSRNYYGDFENFGGWGNWWSSTGTPDDYGDDSSPFYRFLHYEDDRNYIRSYIGTPFGFSVRCLRD